MGVQTALVAISVVAASAYFVWFRLRAPSRRRTLVKSSAAVALGLASALSTAPLTLTLFYATAALGDAFLSREDDEGFHSALATALLSQIFLSLALTTVWIGIDAPVAAMLGLVGIWVGYFMLIWGGLRRRRLTIMAYSLGSLVVMYLALGTSTNGQLAVFATLLYVMGQVLLALEYFLLDKGSLEARLAGHAIWICYYVSLLLFLVVFTT